jgi:predicted amidohydrolase
MRDVIATILLVFCSAIFVSCKQPVTEMKSDSPERNFKLALIQMEVEGGKLDENLARAIDRISKAALGGARIALLPEVMDLGWTHPSARQFAFEIPEGKTCQALCKAARENSIYVCAGIVEKHGDKLYNAAIIIDPSGTVILKHRKINELDIAHDLYATGEGLGVVHTPIGTLGLYICADATAQGNTLSNSLAYMGADIILSPSAWAVPPDFDQIATPYGDTWRKVYQPVSSRFGLWVASVSNVGKIETGPWKDWDCIGASLVYNAEGEEVLQAPYGVNADTILYVDIALKERPARGTIWHKYWEERDTVH